MRRFLNKHPWLRALVPAVTGLWLLLANGACMADMADCPVMPKPCHEQSDTGMPVAPDCPMLTAADSLPGDAKLAKGMFAALPALATTPLTRIAIHTNVPRPITRTAAPRPTTPLYLTHLALLR